MDAEVVPDDQPVEPAATSELAVRGELGVTPQAEASELVARLAVIRDAMNQAMQEGVDYGRIPGTDKPTLLKPGAEKLSALFQLDVQIVNEKTFGPDDHLTVMSYATVYHAPTGTRLGYGEGLCSTREKKYATRKAERVCPDCKQPAVIKGKQEYGGGWLCWKKREGCGAKFRDDDPRIADQEAGQIDNPDLPDLWNTVIKMAQKRARVDAVLAVTGASALFTQDAEDVAEPVATTPPATPPTERGQSSDLSGGTVTGSHLTALRGIYKASGLGAAELHAMLDDLAVKPGEPDVSKRMRALTVQEADTLGNRLARVAAEKRATGTQAPFTEEDAS